MKLRPNYGTYLTEKRVEKGLTMRELSKKTGVPAMNISSIELEKTKGFSLHDLRCYLKGFDIPLSEVMPEDGTLFECRRPKTEK